MELSKTECTNAVNVRYIFHSFMGFWSDNYYSIIILCERSRFLKPPFQLLQSNINQDNEDCMAAFFATYCSGPLQQWRLHTISDFLISEAKETLKWGLYAGKYLVKVSLRNKNLGALIAYSTFYVTESRKCWQLFSNQNWKVWLQYEPVSTLDLLWLITVGGSDVTSIDVERRTLYNK